MGLGFLQGFREDVVLAEFSLDNVKRTGFEHGLYLAMLGLADEAHAIFSLLHSKCRDVEGSPTQRCAVDLFYATSSISSPFSDGGIDVQASQVAALYSNTSSLTTFPLDGINGNGLDLATVTEQRFDELQRLIHSLMKEGSIVHATTGSSAWRLSQALAALLYMADSLAKRADVQRLMNEMANRIHANGQAYFFPLVLVAWKEMFHTGGLLRILELEVPAVKGYADFVLQTLNTRLEKGPTHADDVYRDKSIRELLDELECNTMNDPEYDPEYDGYDAEHPAPKTIYRPPATDELIARAEERIDSELPKELKELLKLSDGCEMVKHSPGFRKTQLVQAEDIYLENDGYLDDIGLGMLSGRDLLDDEGDQFALKLRVPFLDVSGGGIAIFENFRGHEDQVWILPAAAVSLAKSRLQEVYDGGSEAQKRSMDNAIEQSYGSREAYDKMEYCILEQPWGQPVQKVHPSYMSFLRAVVYRARPAEERSPLKKPRD